MMFDNLSFLRFAGILVGLGAFVWLIVFYRDARRSAKSQVIYILGSIGLISVSIWPKLLNEVASMLALEQAQRGRIIALLIFAVMVLWFLVFYIKFQFDSYKLQFDKVVRHLGHKNHPSLIEDYIGKFSIVIVIPAYNEEDNLRELLVNIPRYILGYKVGILVIDDGSVDKTAEISAQNHCLLLKNVVRRGGGAALRLGYDVAGMLNPKVIVTMDADGQHLPSEVCGLVEPIFENKADLVIGSRILGKWQTESKFRFMGLYVFNLLINYLLRVKITDCSSGFRAFDISIPKEIALHEDQYHTSELLIKSIRAGKRIHEVPISINARKHGKSKKGKDFFYGLNFAKVIMKSWWKS